MELWTSEHTRTLLPALAVMLIAAGFLRAVLKNKDAGIRLIPVQVLTCILILLEIGKQVVSFNRGYDLYHIPLHFCSLFIFMLPAMAFYRGKGANTVAGITSALCTAVFALMMIYPNLIYSAGNIENFFGDNFLDFHTVAFHNIVVLEFVLVIMLNLHTPAPRGESKAVVWFMVGFCVVAASMAQILETNYANFYSCNIPVFETLRISMQSVLGAVLTQIIYVLIVAALTVLFVLGFYRLYRLLKKVMEPKQAVAE